MERKCKNKNCQKILPEGYKYKYCENCRNGRAQTAKNVFKGVCGGILTVGALAIAFVTKGKINPGGKA